MFSRFETHLLIGLKGFNHFLHAVLAIALVVASLMVMWEFTDAVLRALHHKNIAQGFLQALGTLFIVWTLSSLIAAEINYVQNGVFHLTVFIEVAIITLLRQLIVEPVQIVTSGSNHLSETVIMQHLLVLGALLVVGILHKLVSNSEKAPNPTERSEIHDNSRKSAR